jgi:hypothetical protein
MRLRPILHRLKTLRYRAIDKLYLARSARAGDVTALKREMRGRNVLVSIAFNDAQSIGWQSRLVRRYLPGVCYVIADNSNTTEGAQAIAALAQRTRAPYLRLPENPWYQPSRSHGLALNWVWRNVILPAEPRAFGFIDDDLYPTAPDDPFAPLVSQDFFGLVRKAGERWFLWAGYCTFRFDRVRDKPLDFGQDWFAGLDTGGGNWEVLFRGTDPANLIQPETRFLSYRSDIEFMRGMIQWCGSWLHEIGSTGDRALDADKRRVIAEILAPHLPDAAADERGLALVPE